MHPLDTKHSRRMATIRYDTEWSCKTLSWELRCTVFVNYLFGPNFDARCEICDPQNSMLLSKISDFCVLLAKQVAEHLGDQTWRTVCVLEWYPNWQRFSVYALSFIKARTKMGHFHTEYLLAFAKCRFGVCWRQRAILFWCNAVSELTAFQKKTLIETRQKSRKFRILRCGRRSFKLR